jgi:hypothetical protein
MTVTDRTTGKSRKNKSHLSDSENGQTGADCTLARFDIRNSGSNVNENEKDQNLSNSDAKNLSTGREDGFFPRNLRSDPQHVLDGMLLLKCLFCERYKTPIQNDMMIHLRYTHQVELLKELPFSGKGFNMPYRVDFVIDIMKQKTPREYYDHNTAKFVPEELN